MCRYKAARCHRCGEAITEAAISCNGQTYHRACYTCTVGWAPESLNIRA